MSTKSEDTIINIGRQWRRNPEPSFPSKNPQVVLDCNIDGKTWLYDTMNETDAYLKFDGETVAIKQ